MPYRRDAGSTRSASRRGYTSWWWHFRVLPLDFEETPAYTYPEEREFGNAQLPFPSLS